MSATRARVVDGGEVLGMQTTEVKPPRAAAAVPVAMVSLAAWPGSRKCTCKSIKPGHTTSPCTSIRSTSGSGLAALPGQRRRFFPSRSRTIADEIEIGWRGR